MLYDTAYLWNLKYAKMDLSAKQKPTHRLEIAKRERGIREMDWEFGISR